MRLAEQDATRSGGAKDELNGGGEAAPALELLTKRATAGRGELVIASAPAILRHVPLAVDEPFVLQALQGGVERALIDLELVARDLLDALADAPAMHGVEGERFEHQEVDGASEGVGLG